VRDLQFALLISGGVPFSFCHPESCHPERSSNEVEDPYTPTGGPSYREAKGGESDFFSSQTPSEHHHRHRTAHRRQSSSTCSRTEVCLSPERNLLQPHESALFDNFIAAVSKPGSPRPVVCQAVPLDTIYPTSKARKPRRYSKSLFRNILDITPLNSKTRPETPSNSMIPEDRGRGVPVPTGKHQVKTNR
jgi:hypothetical protein